MADRRTGGPRCRRLALAAGMLSVLLMPGRAAAAEAAEPDPPRFDHSSFDALLKEHVNAEGLVDYAALHQDVAKLDAYLDQLSRVTLENLPRDEQLALLINAYNAFTLRLIVQHWDGGELRSIRDIPDHRRWMHRRWRVGPHLWSLDEIEHHQIRMNFDEPRVHFALNCAAIGCPPLRNEAYVAQRLDEQLEEQTREALQDERWVQFNDERNLLYLSPIFAWYESDFEASAGTVIDFVARYVPALKESLRSGREPSIRPLTYDWRLNVQSEPRP